MTEEHRLSTEKHLLHFRNAPQAEEAAPLIFNVGMKQYRIQPHTRATRSDARDVNPLLRLLPDSGFSHFLEVDLPSAAIAMMYVSQETKIDGNSTDALLSLAIHVPREGRLAQEDDDRRRNNLELHPKLALLALSSNISPSSDIAVDLLHDMIDPFETATALLFQHPGLINLSSDNGGKIPSVIIRHCIGRALKQKSRLVDRIDSLGDAWRKSVPLMDDGVHVLDEDGKPLYTTDLHKDVMRVMGDPMILALKYSQQLQELEGQTWKVQYGETIEQHDAPRAAALRSTAAPLRADQTKWASKSLTTTNGTSLEWFDFSAPRAGGWSSKDFWSVNDDKTPMTPEFLSALAAGRAFIRIGAWRLTFEAGKLNKDEAAIFHCQSVDARTPYTVTLYLTALHTDLEIVVEKSREHPSEESFGLELGVALPGESERIVWSKAAASKTPYGELRVTVKNEWLRHLSVYAEFFNTAGVPIRVTEWPQQLKDGPNRPVSSILDNHPTKKYIDCLPPIDTIFGIPLSPDAVTMHIPFPEQAASMRLYWGGLGTGKYDETVCACGITCTAVLELAFPVILLLAGAAESHTGFINGLMKDPKVRYGLYAVGVALVGGSSGAYIGLAQDPARAAKTVAIKLGPMLAKQALVQIVEYFARKGIEGAAKRSFPLVNLAFLAFDTAVTVLQLGQTTAAIIQSPFYYETEFTRTFSLRVKIKPDPEFNKFPDYHDLLRVQVIYDSNAKLPLSETKFKATTLSTPFDIDFNDIPAGGKIRVMAFFYADNGWQSAMGVTGWVEAKGAEGSSVLKLELTLKNALIPLSKDSVLVHRQKIAIENGKHIWKATPAPQETMASSSVPGHRLLTLTGITVAQKPAMLGYSWQATGTDLPRDSVTAEKTAEALFTVQNISLLENPESRYAVAPIGFTNQSGIAYDLSGGVDGSGMSFWIDASRGNFDADKNPAGGYHLRRVALSLDATPVFTADSTQSWGRFPRPIDCFVYHPQGYVIGITAEADKLYILQLPKTAGPDATATIASLRAGEGQRDGLLLRPRAIAVALDGRLLVLEDGNRRIQSFDHYGNPVAYFKTSEAGKKSPMLLLRTTTGPTTYLDLSVEAKGYIFVLCYDGNGGQAQQYRVDIYEPDGTFLVETKGVAAAKIAVDLARSMYTLNWETLSGRNGRTEPSISQWLPPPPEQVKPKSAVGEME
jgi:hypothetical protein